MALLEAKQGSIVLLDNFLTEQLVQPVCPKMVLPGPQFLISDDPEYIRVPEALLVQVFQPGKVGEVQTIEMTCSPPGASCLPTPLIFVPVDMK